MSSSGAIFLLRIAACVDICPWKLLWHFPIYLSVFCKLANFHVSSKHPKSVVHFCSKFESIAIIDNVKWMRFKKIWWVRHGFSVFSHINRSFCNLEKFFEICTVSGNPFTVVDSMLIVLLIFETAVNPFDYSWCIIVAISADELWMAILKNFDLIRFSSKFDNSFFVMKWVQWIYPSSRLYIYTVSEDGSADSLRCNLNPLKSPSFSWSLYFWISLMMVWTVPRCKSKSLVYKKWLLILSSPCLVPSAQ